MNVRLKWAIAFIIIGILFTIGSAFSKIFDTPGSNRLLLSGLVAHLSGFGIVVYDLIYARKLH
ncbi:MAG: hypothetical protein N4A46_08490 [Schleiferiaceae bacterium]|jgi:hypothetical protein|nr:hypothetical protein [Schleiferiaceae bacterium]